MTRLIWKEFRERWVWALLWALAILGVSLLGQGQAFCGEREVLWHPWLWVPVTFAVLVGAGGYAGELVGDRATFTFSRPIDWRALLAAKLCFGAILAFGVPVLAALCFRLGSPAPFHALVTPAHVLAGVWAVGGKLAASYLFGLACSVVKPGLAGGVMTMTTALLALLLLYIPLSVLLTMYYQTRPQASLLPGGFSTTVLCLGAWGAALCAAAPLTRFGLTLGVDVRIKRFALTYGVGLLATLAVALLVPRGWMDTLLLRWSPIISYPSPHEKYALVCYGNKPFGVRKYSQQEYSTVILGQHHAWIIRQADGASVMDMTVMEGDIKSSFGSWRWVTDECAYYYCQAIDIVHVDTRTVTRIPVSTSGDVLVSPDKTRLLFVAAPTGIGRQRLRYDLLVIDLATGRARGPLAVEVEPNPYGEQLWWQNDAEIGYQDKQGKCVTVKIPAELPTWETGQRWMMR